MTISAPVTAEGQRQVHAVMAWTWLVFGVYGLVEYVLEKVAGIHIFGVANSIPVLFGISVYANFVGHLSSVQAARAEIKVENATITTDDDSE